jgi:hypothetical protein
MRRLAYILLGGAVLAVAVSRAADKPARGAEAIIVVGAAGTDEYGQRFAAQLGAWKKACESSHMPVNVIGDPASADAQDDLAKLRATLETAAAVKEGQLWLVWIGHGTFDGREAKFNLRGPDVSSREVAEWLKPLQRELVMVQNASAGAAFLQALAGPGRVIVSATKSADEIYYARFGEYFAPAIAGLPEADLDQDRQVSVLEAFLYASRKTAEFYNQEGRLATEHALIEDNGDGAGTRADVYAGVTPQVPEGSKIDGARAAQICLVLSEEEAALTEEARRRRDGLETQLNDLKAKRTQMGDDKYYQELEKILRALAAIYAPPGST